MRRRVHGLNYHSCEGPALPGKCTSSCSAPLRSKMLSFSLEPAMARYWPAVDTGKSGVTQFSGVARGGPGRGRVRAEQGGAWTGRGVGGAG